MMTVDVALSVADSADRTLGPTRWEHALEALAAEVRRLRELDRELGHDQGCERGNCRRCQFEASTIQNVDHGESCRCACYSRGHDDGFDEGICK